MDDFQRQFDESMQAMKELIDFLRIDPDFLNDLLYDDIKPDVIVHETKSSIS